MVQSIFSGRLRPPRPFISNTPPGMSRLGTTRRLSSLFPVQSTEIWSKKMIGAASSQNAASPWLFTAVSHDLPW
jgi:hypothetical protein